MADNVRDTQHSVEVGYSLTENPGNVRETGSDLEAAYSVDPLIARITSFYLEAAFTIGPPPSDRVRNTQHYLEVAMSVLYAQVNVACPFATSYIPGPVRQQVVCQ